MYPAMIWANPFEQDGKVLIEGPVIDLILGCQQRGSTSPEAGGILMGYRRDNHLHVAQASTPQPSDQRMRYRFERSNQFHQAIAISHWQKSGGTVDYIGEWHTHPEQDPFPSPLDISEWKKIYRYRLLPMVFLVIGRNDNLWAGIGCNDEIVEMEILTN